MASRNSYKVEVRGDSNHRANAQLIAKVYGFRWGESGNNAAMFSSIVSGDSILVPGDVAWGEDFYRVLRELDVLLGNSAFDIQYQKPSGDSRYFTAMYGEIRVIERRPYLVCVTTEADDREILPEIAFNRTLRLDRIVQVKANNQAPMATTLKFTDAVFRVTGGLISSYMKRPDDFGHFLEQDGRSLVLSRKIFSSFWFTREVIPYGKDCTVISPSRLREAIVQEIKETLANYEEEG